MGSKVKEKPQTEKFGLRLFAGQDYLSIKFSNPGYPNINL